jgi:putative ABC transport system permease protein
MNEKRVVSQRSLRFLRWFCPPQLLEEIEGDLLQKFERDLKPSRATTLSDGTTERRAKRRLLWNVIRFFRPGIILRNRFSMKLNSAPMLQNYLKITLRNLNKRRAYSFINIFGLAVGVAVCLVIGKYVEFETSYENFHANGKNIYRVVSSFYTDGPKDSYTGYDLGPSLLSDVPEIKRFARNHGNSTVVSFINDQGKEVRFYEPKVLVADSTFLEMFTFKFIYGNSTALYNPSSIVLTKSVAIKYFGHTNAIGKEIKLHDNWPGLYIVSAVIEDVPVNSHFEFGAIMPMHNLLQSEYYRNANARWDNFQTYIETYDKSNRANLEGKIPAFIKKYKGEDKAINAKSKLQFQPLQDIHYSPDLERQGSYRTRIYFFVLIAILIIAWINYINLATARAMERAREVGVKKALGVLRTQLISQFIFESVLVNFLSVLLAIALAWLALPLLNSMVGRSFILDFAQPQLWLLLFILFLVGSLAAGFYPAFVLSSFKTTEIIKGKISKSTSGLSLRNGLVVFQFASSLLLIVGTFAVYRQVTFMHGQEKSFNTEQVMILRGPEVAERDGLDKRMIAFKNELSQIASINKVATSFNVPAKEPSMSSSIRKLGNPIEANRIGNSYWIDPNFMELYKIPLVTGKFWDERIESEMKQLIINEEAVKIFQLGTAEEALKEKLILLGDTFSILGVVKNHHWHSVKQTHLPMVFRAENISATNISIQLNGNMPQAIDRIKQKYQSAFSGEIFSYYFLDDSYNKQYESEQQFGKLFSAFSVLAVLIGCLGLWGLASFTTIHRLKEISIRKVLGASINSILFLLTKQFLKPLLISSLVAFPLVWFGISTWLDQFPYRISLSVDLFLIPLLILVAIALLTISVQTMRSATTNPVNSLKNE